MTNPIAVSQRARRAAENLNYSGGDLSSNARAFARFEAEIRADVWDTCIETVGSCQLEGVLTPGFADGLSSAVPQIQAALRNQKDHDHE